MRDAASRKYLTLDHNWYMPSAEMLERLREHANSRGDPAGRPYFTDREHGTEDGPKSGNALVRRAHFRAQFGVTNVWREEPLHGTERLKARGRALHRNQKPLKLLQRIIEASSEPGDVVWEPFGGLCSVNIAAANTGRPCYSAEISRETFEAARARMASYLL